MAMTNANVVIELLCDTFNLDGVSDIYQNDSSRVKTEREHE